MSQVNYQLEILDRQLHKVGEIVTPMPIDSAGNILRFTKELSNYGQCTFRVSTFDSILAQDGDILLPHKYHLRIRRNRVVVWQGAIIDNSKRNKSFTEVVAAEYEYYLSKLLVNRSSIDPATSTADGIFRIFNSGTMASAVTAVMNELVARLNTPTNSNSIISGLTLGTIDNPNFPPNMTNNLGQPLSGAWNFSTTLQLTFDFQSILYVLRSFGLYAYSDFYIDNNLVFNFKKFVGNNRSYNVNFNFSKRNSNILDYNIPRLGDRMVNSLYGIATDNNGTILNDPQSDQSSISEYGLMEGVAAYSDVKDQGTLNARTAAELPLVATPDETNVVVVLGESAAYPLGTWDIGDIVNINIQNNGANFSDTRRVVGVTVLVHNTGKETTTVQTNKPLPWQYGDAGA